MSELLPKDEYRAKRREERAKEKPPEPVKSELVHDTSRVPRPFRRAAAIAKRGGKTRRVRKAHARALRVKARHGVA